MARIVTITIATMAILSLAVALPARNAAAQQKRQVSFKVDAANSKFTQQLFLDVGDVPGHQVRALEIHRLFPSNPPEVNGLKVKETWTRGYSDYTDNNGHNSTYTIWVVENGDKFFVRGDTVAQSSGGGKLSFLSASSITGGTGKLAGIQGIVRSSGNADPKMGFNESQYEIEYWSEK